MPKVWLETDGVRVEKTLHEEGFTHLHVRVYGKHLVIYSEDGGERENRARFTPLRQDQYQLGMADHRGKWDSTPFAGTVGELLKILIEQFGFTMAPW